MPLGFWNLYFLLISSFVSRWHELQTRASTEIIFSILSQRHELQARASEMLYGKSKQILLLAFSASLVIDIHIHIRVVGLGFCFGFFVFGGVYYLAGHEEL